MQILARILVFGLAAKNRPICKPILKQILVKPKLSFIANLYDLYPKVVVSAHIQSLHSMTSSERKANLVMVSRMSTYM